MWHSYSDAVTRMSNSDVVNRMCGSDATAEHCGQGAAYGSRASPACAAHTLFHYAARKAKGDLRRAELGACRRRLAKNADQESRLGPVQAQRAGHVLLLPRVLA